jgi:hypothetical protein
MNFKIVVELEFNKLKNLFRSSIIDLLICGKSSSYAYIAHTASSSGLLVNSAREDTALLVISS